MTLPAAIMTALITFSATNIDDIFILMMFFSQTDRLFRRTHVIAGQYLGFATLVALSLPGFVGGMMIPREVIGLLGVLPIVIGIHRLMRPDHPAERVEENQLSQSTSPVLRTLLHPKTYTVAAVTFANGGDNIGVYTPLFASIDLASLVVIVIVFFLLVLAWCAVGVLLSRQRHLAELLSRYGQRSVPVVLIVLGMFIVLGNGTLHWLILSLP